MGKINDLIAENKLAEAAEILYDNLYTIINTYQHKSNINRAEFDKVAPELIKKMQNPVSEKEKTDAPGDDIDIVPTTTAPLTIKFDGVEGMKDVVKKIIIGQKYSYTVPTVEGYEADKEKVEGTMTEDGVEVTVTYTEEAAPEPPVVEKGILLITYVGPEDAEFTAPEAYTAEVEVGKPYSVESPTVEGFTPDIAVVEGTMVKDGVEVTVTYVEDEEEPKQPVVENPEEPVVEEP